MRITLFLLLSFGALLSYAALAPETYRIETQVADQSDSARLIAAKTNLADLISRVSGDSQLLQSPVVVDAINNAQAYVQQFSYLTDKDTKTPSGVKLVLNYSPQAIDKILLQAQIASGKTTASQSNFVLQVSDVQNFSDFKQLQQYLKTIVSIRHSELTHVNKDTLALSLTIDGDVALFTNTLASGNKLQPLVSAEAKNNYLYFRWQH